MRQPTAETTGTLGRLKNRRQKTAGELLEAARRVIAGKGYHNTKIVDIAREAHVGVGTFYLYYPTKQAIFLELVDDTYRKLKSEMDAVQERVREPDVLVRESTATFLHFAQENRELFRIVFGHGANVHEVVAKAHQIFLQDSIANLEAGMAKGLFRPNRSDVVARAVMGLTRQVVTWWLDHEEIPVEEVREAIMDIVFHGILAEKA